MPTIRPTSRSRWSTSASPPSASAPQLTLPALTARAAREADRATRQSISAIPQQPVACPIYRSHTISAPARAIAGPALIQEHGTTTVLFEATTGARVAPIAAKLIDQPVGADEPHDATPSIRSRSKSSATRCRPIANEMAADLQRTSYNMMIYEVRDFCTALLNTEGELISQNVGGVSHFVADLGVIIIDGMKRYGANGFAPGDVVITNHQAVAGQHLNNIVIYTPVFLPGRAADVRHGARALDRRRRHDAPASAPARRSPIRGSRACSSISSRSTRAASSTRRSIA